MEPGSAPSQLPAEAIPATLAGIRRGDRVALDRLFSAVYQELHELAQRQLGSGQSPVLSATGLVHELYLKFAAASCLDARDRSHFLAVSARAMRQIIIDSARRARASKRQAVTLTVPGATDSLADLATDMIALDAALAELQQTDARLCATVELRFFGGLSVEETAATLGVSPRTVKRDWHTARAFLQRALATAG